MIISLLYTQPLLFFISLLAIVYGITVHEFAHVLAARLQGDDTGERMGRLTLNPLAHIDLLGFTMLLFAGFGWGKPAPYNPYNLKFRKWGEVLVSLGGPMANLLSIFAFGFTMNVLIAQGLGYPTLSLKYFFDIIINQHSNLLIEFLFVLVIINIVLFIFNLIPIPPLDGSALLFRFLPARWHHIKANLAKNGPWILIMLIIADRFMGINIFGALFGLFLRQASRFL